MGKKNNKPSAYMTFLLKMKPIVEKKLGRHIPMDEMREHIAPEWNKMSAEEKAQFAPHKNNIPLDSFGVPLYVHEEAAEHRRKVKEDMIAGIRNMVDLHVTGAAMRELEVVVVAVTDYITTEENQVFPAEVSLVRLTLGGGLDPKQYHGIINPPAAWPLGYAAAVRTHVAATHSLPTDRRSPDCVGTDSNHQVAAEMTAFISQKDDSGRLCPVFTLEERLDITRTVFRQSFGMEAVDVWALENLLREAYGALYPQHAGVYTNIHARDELVNSPHSPEYHPALGCKWHREERPDEVNHCSLNMAQRWGFMLLHALSVDSSLGVTLEAGRHWPGPNTNRGQLVQLGTQHQKRNTRRYMSSLQTINTACEGYSDTETGSLAGSRASVASTAVSSSSRRHREKTWQEIEDGPKTPVLRSTEEFPSLGGGRRQAGVGAPGARGAARGACGGGPSTRPGEAGASADDPPSGKQNGSASSKGIGRGVSMKNVAASLLAKSRESLVAGRPQGAIAKSRVVARGACASAVEEQLRQVDLNGVGPSRAGEAGQRGAAASVNAAVSERAQHNGAAVVPKRSVQRNARQLSPVAAEGLEQPIFGGIGRGRKL